MCMFSIYKKKIYANIDLLYKMILSYKVLLGYSTFILFFIKTHDFNLSFTKI